MQSDQKKKIEIESSEEHEVLTGEEQRTRPREKVAETIKETPRWQRGNRVAEEKIEGRRQHCGAGHGGAKGTYVKAKATRAPLTTTKSRKFQRSRKYEPSCKTKPNTTI